MNHPPIEGRFVRLEPFMEAVKDELRVALDCDPKAWALLSACGAGDRFEAWWDDGLAQVAAGGAIKFAIRRLSDGRIVGTSSLQNLRRKDLGVEIGSTFLHPDARGSAVNPETKRLMLAHAFEGDLFEAPARRVDLMTDLRNLHSQAAISKLGAVREGVLRQNKVLWNGRLRDTVVYAIIASEWPEVRDRLDARLATF